MNPELREAVQKLMKLASRMSVELYLGGSVLQKNRPVQERIAAPTIAITVKS